MANALPPVHTSCPSCGDPTLHLVEAAVTEPMMLGHTIRNYPPPTRTRDVIAVACMACEFIAEVKQ